MTRLFFLLSALFFVTGCATQEKPKPPKTELEMRPQRMHYFENQEPKAVMEAILAALQEDGYVVKNVSLDLGFLSCTKESAIGDDSNRFWSRFSKGGDSKWPKNEVVDGAISLKEFPGKTRVRVTFNKKVFDNTGVMMTSDPIVDEEFYSDFYEGVNRCLILQSSY